MYRILYNRVLRQKQGPKSYPLNCSDVEILFFIHKYLYVQTLVVGNPSTADFRFILKKFNNEDQHWSQY